MTPETIKLISDFSASVGIPGALLFLLAWGGIKLIPSIVKFLEGITTTLTEIKVVLVDMKNEMQELNGRSLAR